MEAKNTPTSVANGNLTIFTIPKPFVGHIGLIQRNAILSWQQLQPRPEIILLGDDDGTAEIAAEFGLKHFPAVEKSDFGTPLVSSMFEIAQRESTSQFLMYINADIILLNDFIPSLNKVAATFEKFVLVGQRCDFDLTWSIDFTNSDWENTLRQQIDNGGKMAGPRGIDYFCFPRGKVYTDVPTFAVGRGYWDNWLLFEALRSGSKLVDATHSVKIIHQNHPYANLPNNFGGAFIGGEADINMELMRSRQSTTDAFLLTYADLELTPRGFRKPARIGHVLNEYEKLIVLARPHNREFILCRRAVRMWLMDLPNKLHHLIHESIGLIKNLFDQAFAKAFHIYDCLRQGMKR